MPRIILHVDEDSFYASVEARDTPALRNKPLIIGSLPTERGVVSTCSYEARNLAFIRQGKVESREAAMFCYHLGTDFPILTAARYNKIYYEAGLDTMDIDTLTVKSAVKLLRLGIGIRSNRLQSNGRILLYCMKKN